MTTLSNEQLREKISDELWYQFDGHPDYIDGSVKQTTDFMIKLLASQRQAILEEVREGIIHVSIDYSMSPLGYSREMKKVEDRLMSRQLEALEALEKKYKGGEETPKEKI